MFCSLEAWVTAKQQLIHVMQRQLPQCILNMVLAYHSGANEMIVAVNGVFVAKLVDGYLVTWGRFSPTTRERIQEINDNFQNRPVSICTYRNRVAVHLKCGQVISWSIVPDASLSHRAQHFIWHLPNYKHEETNVRALYSSETMLITISMENVAVVRNALTLKRIPLKDTRVSDICVTSRSAILLTTSGNLIVLHGPAIDPLPMNNLLPTTVKALHCTRDRFAFHMQNGDVGIQGRGRNGITYYTNIDTVHTSNCMFVLKSKARLMIVQNGKTRYLIRQANVISVCSTIYASVILLDNGTVIMLNVSGTKKLQARLTNQVQQIHATGINFVALLANNTVFTWSSIAHDEPRDSLSPLVADQTQTIHSVSDSLVFILQNGDHIVY